jgi:ABC-type transport system involved in multi-copper enzyme maturation permease subunit
MHLVAADRVRFGRRRDLWILVILVPILLGIMFVAEFNAVTTPPNVSFFVDPPDPVLEAQMRDQQLADFNAQLADQLPAFTFPASLVKVAGNIVPLILLAIYLATALVAGEFEWGTVRTIHLTANRGRTMAVRIGVVVGLIAVATALALVLGAIIPFLLSFNGRPLQDVARPVPGLLSDVGIRVIAVLPFVAIPALLSILARSTGLAFLLTLLFFGADVAFTGAPFWHGTAAAWIPAVTVSGSISRLLGDDGSPIALLAPAWVSVGALLAWGILPAIAAIARFRRLDINE